MANERVVTCKDFECYEEGHKSKKFDMRFSFARKATGLPKDEYYAIRVNCRKMKEIYNTRPDKEMLLGRG